MLKSNSQEENRRNCQNSPFLPGTFISYTPITQEDFDECVNERRAARGRGDDEVLVDDCLIQKFGDKCREEALPDRPVRGSECCIDQDEFDDLPPARREPPAEQPEDEDNPNVPDVEDDLDDPNEFRIGDLFPDLQF